MTRRLNSAAPPCLGWRCLLSPPPPPSSDKRRRECAEPTFTTAGTSKASLLNPVSNGYQHRASNVIRPAAATSLRGEPVRARARRRCSPGAPRGESTGQHERGYLSPQPSREHDSLLVRVTGRCPQLRTAPAAWRGGPQGAWEVGEGASCGTPRSPAPLPPLGSQGWDRGNIY